MKKSFIIMLALVLAVGIAGSSSASPKYIFTSKAPADSSPEENNKEQSITEEASHRGVKLITKQKAESIAINRLKAKFRTKRKLAIRVNKIELDNDTQPVYKLECTVNGRDYNVDIDAVTGAVLSIIKREE